MIRIRKTFATKIQERIEPVVKVSDRRPAVLLNELSNLVVTAQWERYLYRMLDAYVQAMKRDAEQGVGIWISGFFGSGKSLLMKVLGALLEGGEMAGESVHEVFLSRLPADSRDRADMRRFLSVCQRYLSTTAIGGNLHAQLTTHEDSLALAAFKLFAHKHGYSYDWPFAWAVEYQIDLQGLSEAFRDTVSEQAGQPWQEVRIDPEFYLESLYQAAAIVLPHHFRGGAEAVARSVEAITRSGVDAAKLIERLRRWCERQDTPGKRHKLLLQLDELGQWIASGNANERIMQVQALTEEAANHGGGRIWIAVTAHGDVQALRQNVQQEQYAKIIQRFAIQAKLSNEDISQVVEARLLRKQQKFRVFLTERFKERRGELTDLGTVRQAKREYRVPTTDNFALFYPYLPWTVDVIPDVVKGIAQAVGRDEALTGSNRTMIGVVQGAIIETEGLLDSAIGRLLPLADLYPQLADDVPIETKTDLNRIASTVPQATAFTTRVAKSLFLLGQAQYIPTTLENVTRGLIDQWEPALSSLMQQTKQELSRLVKAGYAKQVADQYVFLSTQQRTFQDKVRERQEELIGKSYELSQALKTYDGENALRFDQVPMSAGREIALKLEIDERVVRNRDAKSTLRLFSPIQRSLDAQIADDQAMRQRSQQEPDTLFFRLADVEGFRRTLALAVATQLVADETIQRGEGGEEKVARQAKQVDLPAHQQQVRRLLAQAVREGTIFFRGSSYQLAAGKTPHAAVRSTLAQILPNIYPRFSDVPQRITNEESAVKAALAGRTTNGDLNALAVYKADGTLKDNHPLLSALRAGLPQASDQQPVHATSLRDKFERPPFGWDGHVVKVGLALLLRASACRLIHNGQPFTDPSRSDVVQLLTKERQFKTLRVQGVRTDLTMSERRLIRTHIQRLFGVKPSLVPATLHNALGQQLTGIHNQAQALQQWASTAQCLLPLEFESGTNLVVELLDLPAPPTRLPHFLQEAERLQAYKKLLQSVADFRREHADKFLSVRDFFNQMVYANSELDAVRDFIQDWRTLTKERSMTDIERWNELLQSHRRAQQAINQQINQWRTQAETQLADADRTLETQVRAVNVPDEKIAAVVAELKDYYQQVRDQLRQSNLGLYDATRLLSALTSADLDTRKRLRELQVEYQVADEPPVLQEVHLQWSHITGDITIRSTQELDTLLARLRQQIQQELDANRVVIIK